MTTVWAMLGAALVLAACHRARPPRVVPPRAAAGSAAPLRVATANGVRTVALEEYVAGCVVAELGPSGSARMREVQAILCRTYAVGSRGRHSSAGFDLCATTHCQIFRPAPGNEAGRVARDAAEKTRGVVLTFAGGVVVPVYHADCGGATSAGDDVWSGNAVPWLRSVKEEVCARTAPWTFRADVDRLGRALASDSRFALRLPLQEVTVDRRDAAGRAALVRVRGANTVVIRGDQFRAVVSAAFGIRSLRSTRFSVRRVRRELEFVGRGFGHGVGLCQAGARRLAERGMAAAEILTHYFPGTRLSRLE